MEICFHAGLHKSGTTTVQYAMTRAFGKRGRVWYPVLHPYDINHHFLVLPFLKSSRYGEQFFDVMVNRRPGGSVDLRTVVARASRSGVERLVISSESLDMLEDDDVDDLREDCLGNPVRVVFTVTPPLHRWASLWQENVRFGLGAAPMPARTLIEQAALLRKDMLGDLIARFPAERKFVRLVPRDPYDDDLVSWVCHSFGIGTDVLSPQSPANTSLGGSSALLAYLNSRGLTNGIFTPSDERILGDHLARFGDARIDDFSRDDFAVPEGLAEVANAECDFLVRAADDGLITLSDPASQLSNWAITGLPGWYREIRDGSTGPGGLLRDPEVIRAEWARAIRCFAAEWHLRKIATGHAGDGD